MGWERRGNTGTAYYYRSRRAADGRVVKEYVGRGERAIKAAEEVACRESERESDRQAVQDLSARLASLDRLTEELDRAVRLLLEAYLLASGYHRGRNYDSWRKKRGQGNHVGIGAGSHP
jgi:hypothetical protein